MAGLAPWIRQIRPALRPVLLLDYHHERYSNLSCLSVFLLQFIFIIFLFGFARKVSVFELYITFIYIFILYSKRQNRKCYLPHCCCSC